MNELIGAIAIILILWIALIITGRISDKLSGRERSNLKEESAAAATVVLITVFFAFVFRVIGISPLFLYIVYFGLCYKAYQLNDASEIVYFYLLHGSIIRFLIAFGFGRLIKLVLGSVI